MVDEVLTTGERLSVGVADDEAPPIQLGAATRACARARAGGEEIGHDGPTKSVANRWPLPVPGLGFLDLRRKLEQQVLLAEPTDKLHADWQARVGPRERQADSRLAGNVLQRREWNVIDEGQPALHHIGLLKVDRANLHRWRCEHRRNPGVVRLLPFRDLPREACKLAQQSWYCAAVTVLPN
jgi:hypothetical protein